MNETIFHYLNNLALQNDTFDFLVVFATNQLGLILLFGLLLFIFSHKHKQTGVRNVAVILSSAVAAWLIAKLIKFSFPMPRPFVALENVNLLFEHGNIDSFPSGHATFFFGVAVALSFYHRFLGGLYIAGAILIGLSRVIAGVHWPIDILAGYFLGGAIAAFVYWGYSMRNKQEA